MKNEELIKTIIKEGYDISLEPQNLNNLDFVLTKNQAKNIDDYKKIIGYLDWYTQKTIRQGYKNFTREYSLEIYARYLKTIETIPLEIMPEKDMYYLDELIHEKEKKIRKEYEVKIKKQIRKEALEQYDKNGYYWDILDKIETEN